MKKSIVLFLLILAACKVEVPQKEKVAVAGALLIKLRLKELEIDSLRAVVFTMDPERAAQQLVKTKEGYYLFSNDYKKANEGNEHLYKLIGRCNNETVAYHSTKKYVLKELLNKVKGKPKDSLMIFYKKLE